MKNTSKDEAYNIILNSLPLDLQKIMQQSETVNLKPHSKERQIFKLRKIMLENEYWIEVYEGRLKKHKQKYTEAYDAMVLINSKE